MIAVIQNQPAPSHAPPSPPTDSSRVATPSTGFRRPYRKGPRRTRAMGIQAIQSSQHNGATQPPFWPQARSAPASACSPVTSNDARRLYYVLRTIDDLVDEDNPQAAQRVDAIERWAHGQGAHSPETSTLADLSRRYPLAPQTLIEFCKGMRQDLEGTKSKPKSDLKLYCQYVGGTVGIMLAKIFGHHPPRRRHKEWPPSARAMQRTNILRDIDEDRAHGRPYIARTTIERYGIPLPDHAKNCCATRSPHRRALRRRPRSHTPPLPRPTTGWASPPPYTARSSAKSNATATDAPPDAQPYRPGANDYSPPNTA